MPTTTNVSRDCPPPLSPQCLDVARHGGTALVMVLGLGNMHLAPTLQAFVEDGIPEGCVRVVLDLGPCRGMDSTFMGTMVGLCSTLREHDGWLCVTNVGKDNERLLKTLGAWEFIAVIHRPSPLESVPLVRLYPTTDTATRLQQIQTAHRHLVEIDEANRERFGSFLHAIETEMAVNRKAEEDDILAIDGLEELPPETRSGPLGASPGVGGGLSMPTDFPSIPHGPPPPSFK